MVRIYAKKKNEPDVNEETIKIAVSNVVRGTMSIRNAVSTFGIKKSTLHDRVSKSRQ